MLATLRVLVLVAFGSATLLGQAFGSFQLTKNRDGSTGEDRSHILNPGVDVARGTPALALE